MLWLRCCFGRSLEERRRSKEGRYAHNSAHKAKDVLGNDDIERVNSAVFDQAAFLRRFTAPAHSGAFGNPSTHPSHAAAAAAACSIPQQTRRVAAACALQPMQEGSGRRGRRGLTIEGDGPSAARRLRVLWVARQMDSAAAFPAAMGEAPAPSGGSGVGLESEAYQKLLELVVERDAVFRDALQEGCRAACRGVYCCIRHKPPLRTALEAHLGAAYVEVSTCTLILENGRRAAGLLLLLTPKAGTAAATGGAAASGSVPRFLRRSLEGAGGTCGNASVASPPFGLGSSLSKVAPLEVPARVLPLLPPGSGSGEAGGGVIAHTASYTPVARTGSANGSIAGGPRPPSMTTLRKQLAAAARAMAAEVLPASIMVFTYSRGNTLAEVAYLNDRAREYLSLGGAGHTMRGSRSQMLWGLQWLPARALLESILQYEDGGMVRRLHKAAASQQGFFATVKVPAFIDAVHLVFANRQSNLNNASSPVTGDGGGDDGEGEGDSDIIIDSGGSKAGASADHGGGINGDGSAAGGGGYEEYDGRMTPLRTISDISEDEEDGVKDRARRSRPAAGQDSSSCRPNASTGWDRSFRAKSRRGSFISVGPVAARAESQRIMATPGLGVGGAAGRGTRRASVYDYQGEYMGPELHMLSRAVLSVHGEMLRPNSSTNASMFRGAALTAPRNGPGSGAAGGGAGGGGSGGAPGIQSPRSSRRRVQPLSTAPPIATAGTLDPTEQELLQRLIYNSSSPPAPPAGSAARLRSISKSSWNTAMQRAIAHPSPLPSPPHNPQPQSRPQSLWRPRPESQQLPYGRGPPQRGNSEVSVCADRLRPALPPGVAAAAGLLPPPLLVARASHEMRPRPLPEETAATVEVVEPTEAAAEVPAAGAREGEQASKSKSSPNPQGQRALGKGGRKGPVRRVATLATGHLTRLVEATSAAGGSASTTIMPAARPVTVAAVPWPSSTRVAAGGAVVAVAGRTGAERSQLDGGAIGFEEVDAAGCVASAPCAPRRTVAAEYGTAATDAAARPSAAPRPSATPAAAAAAAAAAAGGGGGVGVGGGAAGSSAPIGEGPRDDVADAATASTDGGAFCNLAVTGGGAAAAAGPEPGEPSGSHAASCASSASVVVGGTGNSGSALGSRTLPRPGTAPAAASRPNALAPYPAAAIAIAGAVATAAAATASVRPVTEAPALQLRGETQPLPARAPPPLGPLRPALEAWPASNSAPDPQLDRLLRAYRTVDSTPQLPWARRSPLSAFGHASPHGTGVGASRGHRTTVQGVVVQHPAAARWPGRPSLEQQQQQQPRPARATPYTEDGYGYGYGASHMALQSPVHERQRSVGHHLLPLSISSGPFRASGLGSGPAGRAPQATPAPPPQQNASAAAAAAAAAATADLQVREAWVATAARPEQNQPPPQQQQRMMRWRGSLMCMSTGDSGSLAAAAAATADGAIAGTGAACGNLSGPCSSGNGSGGNGSGGSHGGNANGGPASAAAVVPGLPSHQPHQQPSGSGISGGGAAAVTSHSYLHRMLLLQREASRSRMSVDSLHVGSSAPNPAAATAAQAQRSGRATSLAGLEVSQARNCTGGCATAGAHPVTGLPNSLVSGGNSAAAAGVGSLQAPVQDAERLPSTALVNPLENTSAAQGMSSFSSGCWSGAVASALAGGSFVGVSAGLGAGAVAGTQPLMMVGARGGFSAALNTPFRGAKRGNSVRARVHALLDQAEQAQLQRGGSGGFLNTMDAFHSVNVMALRAASSYTVSYGAGAGGGGGNVSAAVAPGGAAGSARGPASALRRPGATGSLHIVPCDILEAVNASSSGPQRVSADPLQLQYASQASVLLGPACRQDSSLLHLLTSCDDYAHMHTHTHTHTQGAREAYPDGGASGSAAAAPFLQIGEASGLAASGGSFGGGGKVLYSGATGDVRLVTAAELKSRAEAAAAAEAEAVQHPPPQGIMTALQPAAHEGLAPSSRQLTGQGDTLVTSPHRCESGPGLQAAYDVVGGGGGGAPPCTSSFRNVSTGPTTGASAAVPAPAPVAWCQLRARTCTTVDGRRVLLLMMSDVTRQIQTQQRVAALVEQEHRILEALFPRHVIAYLTTPTAADIDEDQANRMVGPTGGFKAPPAPAQAPAGPGPSPGPGSIFTSSRRSGASLRTHVSGTAPHLSGSNIQLSLGSRNFAGLASEGGGGRGPETAAPGCSGGDSSGGDTVLKGQNQMRKLAMQQQLAMLKVSRLATQHRMVTILFSDIVGFTAFSRQVPPITVMRFLNELYQKLDALLDIFKVYKVETIGDCYVVAGGLVRYDSDGLCTVLPEGNTDELHAVRVMEFAKAMLRVSREVMMPTNGQPVQVRLGLHSGPAMSGVVGTKMPRFTVFGETVEAAHKMESSGRPGRIHVSGVTRELLRREQWEPTEGVQINGRGKLDTYLWVEEEEDNDAHKQRVMAVYL